jgi:mannan endo-1,4-beta-mannosidase
MLLAVVVPVVLAAALLGGVPAHAAGDTAGIRVRDGRLVEATGSDLVLRGINHDFIWYPHENSAFPAIKAAGANAVRIPFGIGHHWPATDARTVAAVIAQCRRNHLICVLDAHDTTGYGQDPQAATIAEAVRFWIGVRAALIGQENYAIIDIANEPFANGPTWPWAAQTADAIRQLRHAGLRHTLMVDAPGWGQDESYVMRDHAAQVMAADPTGDTVFDIHMYGQFNTAAKVQDYLDAFTRRHLPIVIGEFSSKHEWGTPDADAIMASARAHQVGYIAWSWSGNDKPFSYLDLVNNFDAASRTAWGRRFITGPNGLTTGAREATIYHTDTGTPAGAPQDLTVSDVTSTSARLTWHRRPGLTWLTTYQIVAVDATTDTRLRTTHATTATVTGLKPSTGYTFAVYARNLLGHRTPRSATVVAVTPP